MRSNFSVPFIALAILGATSAVHADTLFDSITGTTTRTQSLARPHIPPTSGDLTGQGDEFSTGASLINITSLSFLGNAGSPSTNTAVSVQFRDSTGTLVTSVNAAPGEITGTNGLQTLAAADFGPLGITIPGNGYIMFVPTSVDGVNRPALVVDYTEGAPAIGTDSAATSAQLDYQGTFQTGAFQTGFVFNGSGFTPTPSNVLQFQLFGTAVPEPASLGLLASGGLLLLRRRSRA